jgi:hypothetical protein
MMVLFKFMIRGENKYYFPLQSQLRMWTGRLFNDNLLLSLLLWFSSFFSCLPLL